MKDISEPGVHHELRGQVDRVIVDGWFPKKYPFEREVVFSLRLHAESQVWTPTKCCSKERLLAIIITSP